MTVRDLPCWPPNWRAVATGASHGAKGERGLLMAARGDLRAQTLTLTWKTRVTDTSPFCTTTRAS